VKPEKGGRASYPSLVPTTNLAKIELAEGPSFVTLLRATPLLDPPLRRRARETTGAGTGYRTRPDRSERDCDLKDGATQRTIHAQRPVFVPEKPRLQNRGKKKWFCVTP